MNNKKTTKATIEINGIDRSTPDNIVKDGCCSELHNLRYHAGAWRSVNQPKELHRIIKGESELHILYKHPASADNCYIAQDSEGNFFEIEVQDEGVYEVTYTFSEAKGCQKVAHFGNVLLFYAGARTIYYLFAYDEYSIMNPKRQGHIDVACDYTGANGGLFDDATRNPHGVEVIKLFKEKLPTVAGHPQYASAVRVATEEGNPAYPTGYINDWHGELMLFASLCRDDGSVIERTLPIFITSGTVANNVITWDDEEKAYIERNAAIEVEYVTDNHFFSFFTMGCPTLRIYAYNTEDLQLVRSVKIYATRVLPIFDCQKIHSIIQKSPDRYVGDLCKIFADNDWGEQPFYLAKEIQLKDFKEFAWEGANPNEDGYIDYHDEDSVRYFDLELSWMNTLENLESKGSVYEPSDNSIYAFDGFTEYNNRSHIYGVQSILYGGEIDGFPAQKINVEVKADSSDSKKIVPYRAYIPTTNPIDNNIYKGARRSTHLIAYPDSRAASIVGVGEFARNFGANLSIYMERIPEGGGRQLEVQGIVELEDADNIITTAAMVNAQSVKYSAFTGEDVSMGGYQESMLYDSNRLQVSEPNNPQYFLFDKSYQIGSKTNRILAMNSVAMEISDNKTGEFPLFAFTEEGIFALHLSEQFLYNPIAAVNFDRVINENTVAANGVVAYFTEEGLHLISQQSNNLISLPLNNSRGSSFIGSGEALYWSRKHNELIMMSRDGEVFAYSLEHGYWSTRRITAEQAQCSRLNNDMVAIESGGAISILSTQEEHDLEEPIRILLETRPIKLGSMEYKRIETLIVRMASDPYRVPVKISVFGSNDTTNWMLLRSGEIETGSDIRIRHMLGSSRLIKIRLEAMIGQECQLSLLGFIAEYFHRFVSKVR